MCASGHELVSLAILKFTPFQRELEVRELGDIYPSRKAPLLKRDKAQVQRTRLKTTVSFDMILYELHFPHL